MEKNEMWKIRLFFINIFRPNIFFCRTKINNMKKLSCVLSVLIAMFFLVSFNQKTENQEENQLTEDSQTTPLPELDFLKKLKIMPLPYRDSTNFDNHTDKPQMRQTEIEQLKLKSKIPDGFGFTLNHKLNISSQFHAVAVSYQLSDETLYTALITYDKNYNIIDIDRKSVV